MADGRVRVTSIDVMQRFRPALVTFMEEAGAAISSVDSDAGRAIEWVTREQLPYWKKEARRREEALVRAKSELIRKKASGKSGEAENQAVEEKKAVDRAKRRVDEAHEKVRACQKWARELERKIANYKGQVQSLNGMISGELANGVQVLDRMTAALESYAAGPRKQSGPKPHTAEVGSGAGAGEAGGGGGAAGSAEGASS